MSSFSVFQILLGARPAVSVIFHFPHSYGGAPYVDNVCSIRGGHVCSFSVQYLVTLPLKKEISCDIPLQRVLMRLHFLLRLLHHLQRLAVRSVFFHLRSVSPVRLLGLCSIFVYVSTSKKAYMRFENEMSLTWNFLHWSDKFLQGLHFSPLHEQRRPPKIQA